MEKIGQKQKDRVSKLEEMVLTLSKQCLGLVNHNRMLEKRLNDIEDKYAELLPDERPSNSYRVLNSLWGDSTPKY